jgi:hypothetical protein
LACWRHARCLCYLLFPVGGCWFIACWRPARFFFRFFFMSAAVGS